MSLIQAVEQIEEEISKLKQERDELAAQVEVMREALETVADSGICNGAYTLHEECHKAVYGALSLTPSAALREVQARTLEKVECGEFYNFPLGDRPHIVNRLREIATAKRKGE